MVHFLQLNNTEFKLYKRKAFLNWYKAEGIRINGSNDKSRCVVDEDSEERKNKYM